jgi:TonB family protein
MFEPKTIEPREDRPVSSASALTPLQNLQQRRLMVTALALLLLAFIFVLYHDRDFWFPDTQEAEDQFEQVNPAPSASTQPSAHSHAASGRRTSPGGKPQIKASAERAGSAAPSVTTTSRTVLPPLDVEVIAGDIHRAVKPGTNAIQVELQPEAASEAADNAPAIQEEIAARVTDNAAERVQMSADTTEALIQPVKPGYPMLARQMKVQGSVILMALISREGTIQNLRVVSGPPILSGAAREAVKQWHFKPHYEGADTVETVAKVTVNFTISTN